MELGCFISCFYPYLRETFLILSLKIFMSRGEDFCQTPRGENSDEMLRAQPERGGLAPGCGCAGLKGVYGFQGGDLKSDLYSITISQDR